MTGFCSAASENSPKFADTQLCSLKERELKKENFYFIALPLLVLDINWM